MTHLPQGWEVKKLGEIIELKNGFAFKSNLFCDIGIPIIRIKNIQDRLVILNDLVFCNPCDYKNNLDDYLVKQNDILIAMSGATTGKVGIYDSNEKAYLNQRVGLLRIDDDILRKYIFWFLCSKSEQNLKSAFGAAQPNLSTKQIHNIEIPLPPLKEQGRIVGILDLAFEKIDTSVELLKANLANLDELAQSVLDRAFNPLGDSIDSTESTQNPSTHDAQSPYPLPQHWEWKGLEDIANIKGGKRLPPNEKLLDHNTAFVYIRVADFQDSGTINLKSVKFINEKTYNVLKNYRIYDDNLYISIAGTIGKSGIIPKELNGAILTENAVKLEYIIDNILNRYVYFFTISSIFKTQVETSTKIVAQPKLAITRLKQIEIPLPPLQEQEQIAMHLDSVFDKIQKLKELYNAQLQDYEELKQSLLTQAFSGKL